MSDWQDSDEVTTTFGSIQLSLQQAHAAGIKTERERIIGRIKAQICFDALADQEGRCSNHSGKCFELGLLVKELEEAKNA